MGEEMQKKKKVNKILVGNKASNLASAFSILLSVYAWRSQQTVNGIQDESSKGWGSESIRHLWTQGFGVWLKTRGFTHKKELDPQILPLATTARAIALPPSKRWQVCSLRRLNQRYSDPGDMKLSRGKNTKPYWKEQDSWKSCKTGQCYPPPETVPWCTAFPAGSLHCRF